MSLTDDEKKALEVIGGARFRTPGGLNQPSLGWGALLRDPKPPQFPFPPPIHQEKEVDRPKEEYEPGKKYLSADDCGCFIDERDCHWDDIEDWFFCEVLGGCGCGNPDIAIAAMALFERFGNRDEPGREDIKVVVDTADEVLAQWFDSKGWIKHEHIIYGSRLNDEGKHIHGQIVKARKQDREYKDQYGIS